MKYLLSSMSNALCKIKSIKVHTCASVLKASRKAVETASASAGRPSCQRSYLVLTPKRRPTIKTYSPSYVKKALTQFQHVMKTKQQHAPRPSVPIQYGAKKQYNMQVSTAPPLDAKGRKFIQQVCDKFLFLGRAVDSTLLFPINAIASQSANPTEDTVK